MDIHILVIVLLDFFIHKDEFINLDEFLYTRYREEFIDDFYIVYDKINQQIEDERSIVVREEKSDQNSKNKTKFEYI